MGLFEQTILDPKNNGSVSGARYDDNFLEMSREGTISRDAWHSYGEQLIANLLGRTGLTFNIRDFFQPSSVKTKLPGEEFVRIVGISSAFFIDDPAAARKEHEKYDLRLKAYRDGCTLCEAIGEDLGEKWIEERLEELKEALSFNPHIICFNELSYPPAPPLPDQGWTSESLQAFAALRESFERRALEHLKECEYQPFVFLGSFHCLMTLYAIGVIYPWGNVSAPVRASVRAEPWTDKMVRTLKKTPPINLPLLYKKRFPARRVGENTRVPADLNFDIFHTPVGKIAVLICSDVLDLNQFLNAARHNILPSRERIDFILVPSFNESKKLSSMCCELSYAANCAVVLVNANNDQEGYPDTEIFACGLNLDQLSRVKGLGLDIVKNRERTDLARTGGRNAIIRMFELNLPALRGFRNDLSVLWAKNENPVDKKGIDI